MQKIKWNDFLRKNDNPREAFESLCYHLFCRRYNITNGIKADFNQTGLECEPILINTNKYYGFQSKFFDHTINYPQVKESVQKALSIYKKLDYIIIYVNTNSKTSCKAAKDIEKLAKKKNITIEWFTRSKFEISLNQPKNLDLAQLYFDIGDEFGFIRNSTEPEKVSFIQSSEHIALPIVDETKNRIQDISNKILTTSSKIFLITGIPGSGKTVFMHKLFYDFGGLDAANQNVMIKILERNNAVPMIVNLKNCVSNSLENLLRERQNDSKVRGKTLNFTYIFDGLDELKEEKADHVLSYINELKCKNDTKKIIFACRSGNQNKLKARRYFKEIVEYKIPDLDVHFIDQFFNSKSNNLKNDRLKLLKKQNPLLVKEIKDILLIKLFWDAIDGLNETSNVTDLLGKKIDLILDDYGHWKNIDELNLLNPKKETILALNKEISFKFHKDFQFRFTLRELQNFIVIKLPGIDYKSINGVIDYITGTFFEDSSTKDYQNQSFIYQHRRYQEFFFIQRLKEEYEKNPIILRRLSVLTNRDLFENLFLKYARREYEKLNNLPGLIELNLIDVYLGKHRGFGVDPIYYLNSSDFIPALACQKEETFNELFEDENLRIKDIMLIDLANVKHLFRNWQNNENDYRSKDELQGVWENSIALLIESIAEFSKFGKTQTAKELTENLKNIISIFEENDYNSRKDDHVQDPIYTQLENFLFYRLVIKKEDIKEVLNLVRNNYPIEEKKKSVSFQESPKEKLIKSFCYVCLDEKLHEFVKVINDFDDYEFLALLDILWSLEYLPKSIKNVHLKEKVKSFIKEFSQPLTKENSFILFYKKLFDMPLSQDELTFARSELENLKMERCIDWRIYNTHVKYAKFAYVLDIHSFKKYFLKEDEHQLRVYNELGLYAALFKDYVDIISERKCLEAVVRDYIRYVNLYTERGYGLYLKTDVSFLWAQFFSKSNASREIKLSLKKRLITEENNINPISFYLKLHEIDHLLFDQIIDQSDLESYEKQLLKWDDDFQSYVDRCLQLTKLFSNIDTSKARYYFKKGINNGLLRHGWRKDTIVSYKLVDALEILWNKHWISREELEKYTEKVFDLTIRVYNITDGDHTKEGPYNVVNLLKNHDIELAKKYFDKLKRTKAVGYFPNTGVTCILLGMVNLGLAIEEIEEYMGKYEINYDYNGIPRPDYYEQKFEVYMAISQSELYTEEERKEAFDNAYSQIETMKEKNVKYFLSDLYHKEDKLRFIALCKEYKKKVNVTFDKKDEEKDRKSKLSEEKFNAEVDKAKTKQKIRGLYRMLGNYKNYIILSRYESWQKLINKNFELYGNIKLFFNLLEENWFPHTDFFTANSKYFHLALAAALNNIDTKQSTVKYLFNSSGHGGFINVMKAYAQINDKGMCLKLFERYLKFCDFLVN